MTHYAAVLIEEEELIPRSVVESGNSQAVADVSENSLSFSLSRSVGGLICIYFFHAK